MKNPIVKKFIRSMEKSIGRKMIVEGSYGASDARHFANTGAPILMTKPDGHGLHGDDESISISSCMKFYAALQAFLKEF
jgi:acetylornithine deacetylase/succinyl-diaminopimelate desuccinylase-like protein